MSTAAFSAPLPPAVEHQILHPQISVFLPGLAEQHHQHHPLHLLDVDLPRIERQQPVDHQLALRRVQDADVLQIQNVAAAVGVEPRLLARIEHADRARGRRSTPGALRIRATAARATPGRGRLRVRRIRLVPVRP